MQNGREGLVEVGGRILGVTLNRMSEKMSGDYYYYDYSGGYGTGNNKGARRARDGAQAPVPTV